MERINANAATREFRRMFGKAALNELGRICRRERDVTPFRLALSLIESFSNGSTRCIADIQRTSNALCGTTVKYKPFHNQLAKRQFPTFVRLLLSRMLNNLASDVLRFSAGSPFARFEHIRIQDGSSFALKSTLAQAFPGRFTTKSPAAVELHVDFDLLSETANRIVLSPDSSAERQFLPRAEDVAGGLLLADRGYFSRGELEALGRPGAHFIVRAGNTINPLIVRAVGPDGRTVKSLAKRRLKEVVNKLSRFDHLDMTVQFKGTEGPWQCRLVVHPNLRGSTPRYLATNLDAVTITPEHISDGYRLRRQVELPIKEWKSYANLRAVDTSSEHIAEGLIWAAPCAATLKRYCAHVTEYLYSVAISTQTAAKCVHNVLGDVLHALVHEPRTVNRTLTRALNFLAANAGRAKMQRDRKTGKLKLGLQLDPHVLDRGSDDPQHAECDKGQADDLQAMVGVECDSVRLQVIARLAEIDAEADHGDGVRIHAINVRSAAQRVRFSASSVDLSTRLPDEALPPVPGSPRLRTSLFLLGLPFE